MAAFAVLAALIATGTTTEAGGLSTPLAAELPPEPIGHHGRWITDADGRVLLLHGVNLVAKVDGETPAQMGFGEDDAQFLADNGFDVVRLGLTAGSVMPSPGVIDTAYLASFRETIDILTAHGLLVLVDLHQDGWGPSLGSDGFPDWMTITHGAENTHTDFPLYYVTNPAIQAAFDSFWNDETGPGDVTLQARTGAIFQALADVVADNPGVLGYDLLNEPWPGTVWNACAFDSQGCPQQDAALDAYHARMATAIRQQDPNRLLFGEPYVLFNFGTARTNITLPGGDPNSGMSYHLYTTDVALEPQVQDFAIQWAAETCGALLNTEWGATTDVAAIDRQADELDSSLVPWIFWSYDENVVRAMTEPVSDATINETVANALTRPHPRSVAGTPLANQYDSVARTLQFVYSTDRVDGGSWPAGIATELQIAARTYLEGYDVRVTGGRVTSAANADVLTVVADAGADTVTVDVFPAGQSAPTALPTVSATPDACATPVADNDDDTDADTNQAVQPAFTG
jgi:endoglycosylceramidase